MVRLSNLICMWLMFFISICFTLHNFIPQNMMNGKEGKEKNKKEKQIEGVFNCNEYILLVCNLFQTKYKFILSQQFKIDFLSDFIIEQKFS